MNRLFKITIESEKEDNKLLNHLINVAQAWCDGRNFLKIETLDDFHQALNRETVLYCRDHKKADSRDVSILSREYEGVCQVVIQSTHFFEFYRATVELLSETERDHMEVQDSLLIPMRT